MHTKIAHAVIAAVLTLASGLSQAADIYPVDKARFMTNTRFDFKVELDSVVERKDISIEINGKDYRRVLKGDEIYIGQEIDAGKSAVLMRNVEITKPGRYTVTVSGKGGAKTVVWDLYTTPEKRQAKNVILLIADGLSVGHRTAARIMSKGVVNGMYNAPLAMDDMPHMALLGTSSVDTIAADSANTASAYMTGHKSSVNALGVYVDRTKATQDDPRQETIAELIRRKTNMSVGVVSDAELEDATPASVVSHTRRRADKADIVGMFYDVKPEVLLGGGSAYFLPQSVAGSKRKDATNYIELFENAGYKLVTDRDAMLKAAESGKRLLGLFHPGNMDGWLDRHQFKGNTVKKFPNQPDLTDSFQAAVKVLEKNPDGFFLMLEAGLVDKFSHPLDWTRSVAETIAFDKVVEAAQKYCDQHPDTLLIVTGDHTHSISVAGTVDDNKPGIDMREKVGVYANAGYPHYADKDQDGFPDDFYPDKRLAVFFGAHPDYIETYRPVKENTFTPAVKNEKGQYVANAQYKDIPGSHFVPGNLPRNEPQGVHTVDDLVVTARGPNADEIKGFMNSTEIFRVMAEALALGR